MQVNQLYSLKKIELEMFKNFIKICNENNLTYFIIGGTLLGSVRHKGFIPWDDDIDVGMPRNDYEKFLQIAQDKLPDNIFLQTNKTDKKYPMNFAKLRNNNTTFIEKSLKNININHGVYIDIFPLDGYPQNKILQCFRNFKKLVFQNKISKVYFYENGYNQSIKGKILNIITNILYRDYQIAILKRDQLIKKYDYDKCDIVANYCGAWGEKEIMPKEYFGKGVKGMFEGIEVNMPEKYHEYLKQVYGDYMTFPPVEKRVSHHYCTVIDLDNPYTKYTQGAKQ